jgi:hypothetical protein
VNPKHPPGPPMTRGNMRELGVHHLIGYCHNDACRHQALIDVSPYPADTEVPSFQRRDKCGKCGGKRVDVGSNWKERPHIRRSFESVASRPPAAFVETPAPMCQTSFS